MEERTARMALCALLPFGTPDLGRLVAEHGAVEVWQSIKAAGEQSTLGRKSRLVNLSVMVEATLACKSRFIIPGDVEWPTRLDDLDLVRVNGQGGSPLGLWIRGPFRLDRMRAPVAVVGSRLASPYGTTIATDWANFLAVADHTVVSGMAYGIDAAAHRGALLGRKPTVAVLAGGVDKPYPSGNSALMGEILKTGAVVSETPPGSPQQKVAFLARNRVIAGMADAVLLVEAAARSGARNTTSWAAEIGRPVAAVPGTVTSEFSRTPHHLIREGMATLVTHPDDVRAMLGPLDAQEELPLRGEDLPLDRLPADQRTVREAVRVGEVVDAGTLSARTGLSVMDCMAAADELVDAGWLDQAGPQSWALPRRA